MEYTCSATTSIPSRDGGRYSVTTQGTDIDAVIQLSTESAVRGMRAIGETPPAWWQFWREKWSKGCVAEFHRQEAQGATSNE